MTHLDIEPLRDLNDLKYGIHKRWIYRDSLSQETLGNYLQKICFSICDLNKTFSQKTFDYKDMVFIICLVDWIRESVNCISSLFKEGILNDFHFSSQETLNKAKKYFVAIRSFVVAHPLETTRHTYFSLDGTYICVDFFQNDVPMVSKNEPDERFRFIDYDGLHQGYVKTDFYLKVYSSKYYQNKFYLLIGFNLEDIVRYARLCIQKIYELDKYLFKLKIKDFKEVV